MKIGYAINEVGNRNLRIDTVSSTRRAAIVNWLVVSKDQMITADWTDDMIERAWRNWRGENDYCVKVEITCSQGAGANVTEPPQ